MLNEDDRDQLQAFVDRSQPDTAYLRRVRILLLADEELSAEAIAAEVEIPVNRVRQLIRVYRSQGLSFLPETVLSPMSSFSPDDSIAEAARAIMGDIVKKIWLFEKELRVETSPESVHETRKSIRRLRTALQLFEPFFEKGTLDVYRKRFRKIMRRLGRSRDTTVFLLKLDNLLDDQIATNSLSLDVQRMMEDLRQYWLSKNEAANEEIRNYCRIGKYQALLTEFDEFTQSSGMETTDMKVDQIVPRKTRHIAPILIYQQVAAVRAFDENLEEVSPTLLHELRIRFKELRYTLEFFAPILGPTVGSSIKTVKQILIHLGDLNDARVALDLLDDIEDQQLARQIGLYRTTKENELENLVTGFSDLWVEFNQPEWRQRLAAVLAVL
jgi:CHAD domain-containing protein